MSSVPRGKYTETVRASRRVPGDEVIWTWAIFLDVIIMKGRGGELRDLANGILSLRGVKHGQLVVTSTGKDLK